MHGIARAIRRGGPAVGLVATLLVGLPATPATALSTAAPQVIDFAPLPDIILIPEYLKVDLRAAASSGLPVTFTATGPCVVRGATLDIDDLGTCAVTAHQAGDADWLPAPDVTRTFEITVIGHGTQVIAPAATTVTAGGRFEVSVVTRADYPMMGAETTVTFDPAHLTLVGLAKGAGWAATEADWFGYPTAAGMASFLADANRSGAVRQIAAGFLDTLSDVPADTGLELLTLAFEPAACGRTGIGLPLTGSDSSIIAGGVRPGYGYPLELATTGSTVEVDCTSGSFPPTPAPTASPTASPTATPTTGPTASPTASASSGVQASQTIDFAPLEDAYWNGHGWESVYLTARASSRLPVSFTASGPCSIRDFDSPTLVHPEAEGTCLVTAHQAGNAYWLPAPDVTRSFDVRVIGRGTLRVAPSSTSPAAGAPFSVSVITRADYPVSGAETTVTFDRTRLRLVGMAKGAGWAEAGATWVGYPASARIPAFVDAANVAGEVQGIAAVFIDGSSDSPANTDLILLTLTFEAIACGSSELGLPVGSVDGNMLAGGPEPYYGYSIMVEAVGASISVPCDDGSSGPTATPTAAPATGGVGPTAATTRRPAVTPPPTETDGGPRGSGSRGWPLVMGFLAVVTLGALLLPRRRRAR